MLGGKRVFTTPLTRNTLSTNITTNITNVEFPLAEGGGQSWRLDSSLNSPSSVIGLFYADSGFFDGKNLDFWRIGSKPFLWRILKTGEKARSRHVTEPLCISQREKVKREILSFWWSSFCLNLIVGNGPRGSISFTLGCGGGSINSVKRSKTLPTGVFATSRPRGWGLLVTERCVLNHHNWTGSFKMKRFEIFCSDPSLYTSRMAREV